MAKPATPKTTPARRSELKPGPSKPTLVKPARSGGEGGGDEKKPAGAELKKAELIEKVVEVSGIKKRFAKPVVEAMLTVLGDTLKAGRDMNLQPMGKVMAKNVKEIENGHIITTRVRQVKQTPPKPKEALADPAE